MTYNVFSGTLNPTQSTKIKYKKYANIFNVPKMQTKQCCQKRLKCRTNQKILILTSDLRTTLYFTLFVSISEN